MEFSQYWLMKKVNKHPQTAIIICIKTLSFNELL